MEPKRPHSSYEEYFADHIADLDDADKAIASKPVKANTVSHMLKPGAPAITITMHRNLAEWLLEQADARWIGRYSEVGWTHINVLLRHALEEQRDYEPMADEDEDEVDNLKEANEWLSVALADRQDCTTSEQLQFAQTHALIAIAEALTQTHLTGE